jgi:hypothetical protein
MDLQDHAEGYAKKLTDNWKDFQSFGLHDERRPIEEYEGVTIWNVVHRDSDLITEANAKTIEEGIAPMLDGKQAWTFSSSHWGVGWVDGYAVRVRDAAGEFTPAFLYMVETLLALEGYPVLDSSLLSEMECEATLESLKGTVSDIERRLPDDVLTKVERDPMAILRFFDAHYQVFEKENESGYDGYPTPSPAGVLAAMIGLKMVETPHCPCCASGTIHYKKEQIIACTCGVTFTMFGGHETFEYSSLYELAEEDT